MLVVVVWHVTLVWPSAIPLRPSTTSVIQWPLTLSQWSLPVFFIMAGYFGAMLHARWGTARFARDRLLRIGVPLLVALGTIVPATWLLLNSYLSANVDLVRAGPLHVWFLYYVLIFFALVPLVPMLPLEWTRQRLVALLRSAFAAPVLAACTMALLFVASQLSSASIVWVVPQPALVVFYGSFFAFGAVVQGSANGIDLVGRRLGPNAAVTLAALVPTVLLREGPILAAPQTLVASAQSYVWMAAFCLFAWSATFTVFGLGRRFLSVERPALRYIADASYWVYLVHLPLVVALILLVKPLGWPFWAAWLLVLALLFSILLGLYELVVRHSVVGRVLNGRRPPRGWGPRRPGRDRVPEGASG